MKIVFIHTLLMVTMEIQNIFKVSVANIDMDNFLFIVNSIANGVSSSDSVFSTVLIENFRTP